MGINIQIIAGDDEKSSRIITSGSMQHIITDQEVSTFGLNDNALKNAVKASLGQRPDDAYLHSPTPWGDLYKKYGWPEVSVVLYPIHAEILKITSEPIILKEQIFTNNGSGPATFHADISDQVTFSSSFNWEIGGTLSFKEDVTYQLGFLGTQGGGTTEISYSQNWGVGGDVSKSETIGSGSGVDVPLNPGQSAKVELVASRDIMKVRVTYATYMMGCAALNYSSEYNGHHFWGADIQAIMIAGGIPANIQSTEDITLSFFSNSKITVSTNNPDKLLQTIPTARLVKPIGVE